ncbi:MAG: hypothetical protein GC180_10335 [Bacteroidetes bacterium]|nr:hypothetical protein [Bacteroidota bacterium]
MRKLFILIWAIVSLVMFWYISPINKSTAPETAEQAIEEYLQFSENPMVMANRYLDQKMNAHSIGNRLVEGKEYEVFQIGFMESKDKQEPSYVLCATVLWNQEEQILLEESLFHNELIDAMPWR